MKVRAKVKEQVSLLLALASQVSTIDVLQSFSFASTLYGFVRPKMSDGIQLHIEQGHHPVVEAHLPILIQNSGKVPQRGVAATVDYENRDRDSEMSMTWLEWTPVELLEALKLDLTENEIYQELLTLSKKVG